MIWQRYKIKSEKLTPFGGISSIMEQFDALLAQTIDSTLVIHGYYCDKTLKHPNLRIFKGFFNINLRIFVYFMEINLRIFNIIRIFALRKYQIVSNFYIKNKEKNI